MGRAPWERVVQEGLLTLIVQIARHTRMGAPLNLRADKEYYLGKMRKEFDDTNTYYW